MKYVLLLLLVFPVWATETVYTHNDGSRTINITMKEEYIDFFIDRCVAYRIPVMYAYRLIEWESRWDASAIAHNLKGTKDYGLMQLNSAYIKDFEWRYNKGKKIDPLHWKDSLNIGLKHLSVLYKHTGNWYGAIASYNMGLTGYKERVKKKQKLPEATLKELAFIFQ